jgi:hypothetical protein
LALCAVPVGFRISKQVELVLCSRRCDVKKTLQFVLFFEFEVAANGFVSGIIRPSLRLSRDNEALITICCNAFGPDQEISLRAPGPCAELRKNHGIEFKSFGFMNCRYLDAVRTGGWLGEKEFEMFIEQAEIADDTPLLERFEQAEESVGVFEVVWLFQNCGTA